MLRNYEIVFLTHPDQSSKVPDMIKRYQDVITRSEASIQRTENWGRRKLAYPINKVHKAHYAMINASCSKETIEKLDHTFRYNDAILRYLIQQVDKAPTKASPLMDSSSGEK